MRMAGQGVWTVQDGSYISDVTFERQGMAFAVTRHQARRSGPL